MYIYDILTQLTIIIFNISYQRVMTNTDHHSEAQAWPRGFWTEMTYEQKVVKRLYCLPCITEQFLSGCVDTTETVNVGPGTNSERLHYLYAEYTMP